jgi:general transcription factor 3C polypeptide 3 (transcription factor C subunit 4)
MGARIDKFFKQSRAGINALDELLQDHEPKENEIVAQPTIRRRKPRGPRKAAEPTGDIKLRLGRANDAFSQLRIREAYDIVTELIRINAETFEAWLLLSSIFHEKGDNKRALSALQIAAHLRPKHFEVWSNAADYALYSLGGTAHQCLEEARWCYSMAIRNIPTSIEARRGKAKVCVLLGLYRSAASEFKYILKQHPYDLSAVRDLAVAYIDLKEPENGRDLYKAIFDYFRSNPEFEEDQEELDWNDLYSYAVLYGFLDSDAEALKELKSHARWFLGREEESFWDDVTEDDCEWDLYDSRRRGISRYTPGIFPSSSYGLGLPIEIRVSFGKLRLSLGHHEEALVSESKTLI